MRHIIQEQGHIDVLINNAAYALVGTVESCTVQEQKDLFDINYFAPYAQSKQFFLICEKKKEGESSIFLVFRASLLSHP